MFRSLISLSFVSAISASAYAGTIVSIDFNADMPWPQMATDVMPSTPMPIELSTGAKPVGTVDVAHTSDRSGGLSLEAEVGEAKVPWSATFFSGLIPVINAETNLGKLTLAFDLSASIARPVIVRVESFDAAKKRTGGLETTIYPAAPDFYLRSALDLSTMKSVGTGAFVPTDPFIQITYQIEGPAWPDNTKHELHVDNVHYASPAYYVSPQGKDENDGLTEASPFQHPQKAADLAKPGDIILLMGGEYRRGGGNDEQNGIIHFEGSGSPAAWISFKNYPGQTPTLINDNSWNAIRVGGRVRIEALKDSPTAYLELRGLHIRGGADEVMAKYRDDIGLPNPTTNGNGIGGGGVRGGVPSHHIRVADCVVEYCSGGGIGFGDSDWVTIENNIVRNNSWFTIYATSGISTMGTKNFDSMSNVYKTLIRNNRASWNRTYIIWKRIGKVSDGNGIIVDVNAEPATGEFYLGRTLIQNNLSTNNGGSGIHAFKARRVDIVNNTAFQNGASPELRWGQIFVQRSDDMRMVNNILYARDNQPVNTVSKDASDKGNTNIVRANNVYFGGSFGPIMGTDDVIGDPQFVSAWVNPLETDFRVAPSSPALRLGKWDTFVPLTDIDGNLRPLNAAPDAGAFQHSQPSERK